MVSWAVTGATRGIGFGFVDRLSSDANNQVFAVIRSRGTAGPLEKLATKRKNVHIVVTDISDPIRLNQAAAEISKLTGGSLDILILNAASVGPETTNALPPSAFHGKKEALEQEINETINTNVISNIYIVNSFLDLVRSGKEKKIIFISSPCGDVEFTRITGMSAFLGYSISKAGMNIVATKFGVELGQDGIKTLSLSPGWVNTEPTQAAMSDSAVRQFMLNTVRKLDPNVNKPVSVEESVKDQLQVIQKLTEDKSGKFLTHHGNSEEWF